MPTSKLAPEIVSDKYIEAVNWNLFLDFVGIDTKNIQLITACTNTASYHKYQSNKFEILSVCALDCLYDTLTKGKLQSYHMLYGLKVKDNV